MGMGIIFMLFAVVFGIMAAVMFRQVEKKGKGVYLNGQEVEGEEAEKVMRIGKVIMYGVTGLFFVIGLLMYIIPKMHIQLNPFILFPAIPMLLGCIFVGVAVIVRKFNQGVTREGVSAVGVIERVERESRTDFDHDVHVRYVPVVRYYYQGKEYCGKALIGAGRRSVYREGESVEIQLNPQTPQLFHLEQDNKGAGLIFRVFLIVGIVLLVLGMAAAVLLFMLPPFPLEMMY